MTEDEKKLVTFRVSKDLLDSFDITCQPGERAERLRIMMEEEAKKKSGDPTHAVNYSKLKSDADACRREMARLRKALGRKFHDVEDVAESFAPLTTQNVPAIIQQLSTCEIPTDVGLTRDHIEDYIEYLEAWAKNQVLLEKIDAYRRAKTTSETDNSPNPSPVSQKPAGRYISRKDLCKQSHDSGFLPHTMEEHSRYCCYAFDTLNDGIREGAKPEELLSAIYAQGKAKWSDIGSQSKPDFCVGWPKDGYGTVGFVTTNMEKNIVVDYVRAHGSTEDKTVVNSYFHWRLFPIPFPECPTIFRGEVVTEDLDCSAIRRCFRIPGPATVEGKLPENKNLKGKILLKSWDEVPFVHMKP